MSKALFLPLLMLALVAGTNAFAAQDYRPQVAATAA